MFQLVVIILNLNYGITIASSMGLNKYKNKYNPVLTHASQLLAARVFWLNKEDMVHIYNGILLSHKKEQMCVSCSEVDKPRACYTKSERWNKYHILMYIYGI